MHETNQISELLTFAPISELPSNIRGTWNPWYDPTHHRRMALLRGEGSILAYQNIHIYLS